MAGRRKLGCIHTQNASNAQKESYRYAVRLHIATLLKKSSFQAACHTCSNSGVPLCCLDCDFIGCPKHTDHEHPLACCLGSDVEGAVWCFVCRDVVCDPQFDVIREDEIHCTLNPANKTEVQNVKTEMQIAKSEMQNGANGTNGIGNGSVDDVNMIGDGGVPFHAFSGLRGLVNLGATCYVSVVLQSLVHNPLVRAFFLGGGHQRELCTRRSCLVCSLDRLYTDFFGSASVAGYGITDMLLALAEKRPVMGAGSTEQDAHEFYLMLLSEFHSAYKQSPATRAAFAGSHEVNGGAGGGVNGGRNGSANGSYGSNGSAYESTNHRIGSIGEEPCGCVTHRNFAGAIESTLHCECGKRTVRREPIVDLGLDLGSATSTTLEASLQRFVAAEPVAHYTCDECGRQNTTTKQLRVAEPPPALLIQLKRFKHVGGTKGSIKVETPVDFPLQLDFSPYADPQNHPQGNPHEGHTHEGSHSLVYELYGVICHTGTLDTGHYTCMMKHSSGQWYNFDDVSVTPVDVATVKRANRAYLLFYIVKWAV